MKTIKTTVLFISLLLFTASAVAQTNLYPTTRTIQGNGFVFQADVRESGHVTLYNRTNRFTGTVPTFRDGSPLTVEFFHSEGPTVTIASMQQAENQIVNIVRNALSTAERTRVINGNGELRIVFRINPDTGRVMEVQFSFPAFCPFATIPVAVYRTIEVNLINQIQFTPTAKGRRMNYIFYGTSISI